MWDKHTHTLTDQGKETEEMAKERISHTHTHTHNREGRDREIGKCEIMLSSLN